MKHIIEFIKLFWELIKLLIPIATLIIVIIGMALFFKELSKCKNIPYTTDFVVVKVDYQPASLLVFHKWYLLLDNGETIESDKPYLVGDGYKINGSTFECN